MEQFNYPTTSQWQELVKRPSASYDDLEGIVSEIFQNVQNVNLKQIDSIEGFAQF